MEFATTSHVGLVRKVNQDVVRVDRDQSGASAVILADGMGGHVAGEVASSLAVKTVWECLSETSDSDFERRLLEAVQSANAIIFEESTSHADYAGMGTTIVAVLADLERLVIAHVGDSRAYMLRRSGEFTQLTCDHTYVNELVRRGQLAPEAAVHHPQRHVLLRSLGTVPEVVVESKEWSWSEGDLLLVCSDGLTDVVPDDEIKRLLGAVAALAERVEGLLAAALSAGGRDNITIAAIAHDGTLKGGFDA
ncbi:MAG: Stp1/IreP family PP2C-type Ser/Thr phosphatase [Firmicutes bacterium]|nr:Stp1/IreP family PP2C-type Ser/Thr phosphatase [Bacillota bacterium]